MVYITADEQIRYQLAGNCLLDKNGKINGQQ